MWQTHLLKHLYHLRWSWSDSRSVLGTRMNLGRLSGSMWLFLPTCRSGHKSRLPVIGHASKSRLRVNDNYLSLAELTFACCFYTSVFFPWQLYIFLFCGSFIFVHFFKFSAASSSLLHSRFLVVIVVNYLVICHEVASVNFMISYRLYKICQTCVYYSDIIFCVHVLQIHKVVD